MPSWFPPQSRRYSEWPGSGNHLTSPTDIEGPVAELDSSYASEVLKLLKSRPTAQDIDFLVEAYTNIGYLAADAEGLAQDAEMRRKHAEANAYLDARGKDGTVKDAEMSARFAVREEAEAEVAAATKARKLRNLLLAIEQAINAVKFLGRIDSVG